MTEAGGKAFRYRRIYTFELYRHRDPGGVSGTGVVAHGVVFLDGSVALRWLSETPSTSTWDSIEHLMAVHGHLGASEIRWLDGDPWDDEDEDTAPIGEGVLQQ
jgi:hypothetical protein